MVTPVKRHTRAPAVHPHVCVYTEGLTPRTMRLNPHVTERESSRD
jgi:hypothetical protein